MLKDENTRLRVLAEHDWLTGLYNRRAAEAVAEHAKCNFVVSRQSLKILYKPA